MESNEPIFDLKITKNKGVLEQCSTEHSEGKIGYCQNHQVLFCSLCMFEIHGGCIKEIIHKSTLNKKLNELSEIIKKKIENHIKKIEEDNLKFDKLVKIADGNLNKLEEFLKMVIDSVKLVIEKYKKTQEKLILTFKEEVNEKWNIAKEKLQELNKMIEVYDTTGNNSAELQVLLDKYEIFKNSYENLQKLKLNEFGNILDLLNKKSSQITINYDKNQTIAKIEASFDENIKLGLLMMKKNPFSTSSSQRHSI